MMGGVGVGWGTSRGGCLVKLLWYILKFVMIHVQYEKAEKFGAQLL